ncbi:hypothetical protein NL343_28300, partial [Klebsiella pneumoniae]|nr:hypothetical protein [Klebsiella pneumoniae]
MLAFALLADQSTTEKREASWDCYERQPCEQIQAASQRTEAEEFLGQKKEGEGAQQSSETR